MIRISIAPPPLVQNRQMRSLSEGDVNLRARKTKPSGSAPRPRWLFLFHKLLGGCDRKQTPPLVLPPLLGASPLQHHGKKKKPKPGEPLIFKPCQLYSDARSISYLHHCDLQFKQLQTFFFCIINKEKLLFFCMFNILPPTCLPQLIMN